jgi:hypothetical protein
LIASAARNTGAVLAIAGDAGGARALAPVLEVLGQDPRVSLRVLAYRAAPSVWATRDVRFEAVEEDASAARLAGILDRPPALLLTATSYPPGLELHLTAAARTRRVRSAALLDFWSNYAERFRLADGGRVLPDRILVMDDQARDEMLAEGFEAGLLLITGQPALGELGAWRSRFSDARRREIRDAVGAEDRPLVVFVSQPLSQIYGSGRIPELGYDEHTVLRLLAERLQRLALRMDRRLALAVKLHPRDVPAPLPVTDDRRLRIRTSGDVDGRDLVMAADLVVGMNSELLVEACALGGVTLSLQPGLKGSDMLPTNRRGLSRAVYDAADVEPALAALLFDEGTRASLRTRLAAFLPDPRAAVRVTEAVLAMTGLGAERA